MHIKYGKPLLVSILFIVVFQHHAQSKFADSLKIITNYHQGFVIPEYPFMNYITEDYVRSFDLSFTQQTHGKNIWEQLYNYPEYGLSLFYSTLGNNKILGKEIALNYFFKVNMLSLRRLKLYNRTGIGIAYVSKRFDFDNNYLNVAVGSHFNIHFNLRFGTNITLSDKMALNLGLSFDHFSNSNSSEPNLGINYVTGYTGLSYSIAHQPERKKHELENHIKKNNKEFFQSIGGTHTRSLSSKYYITSSLSFEFTREYFRAIYLGAGVDLFYDSSIKQQLINVEKEYKDRYGFQTGIHLSQEFVYNRFSVIIQEGVYVILKDQTNKKIIYNRGILKYRLNPTISIRLSMKSHLNILDYPELGIGFKL